MVLKFLFDYCEMSVKCIEDGGGSFEEKWIGYEINVLKINLIGEYFLLYWVH